MGISTPRSSQQALNASAPAEAAIVAEEGVLRVTNLQRMEASDIETLVRHWLCQQECRLPVAMEARWSSPNHSSSRQLHQRRAESFKRM